MTLKIEELRQSSNWLEYLRFVGWQYNEPVNGIQIPFMKTPFGAVTKIQRPKNLNNNDIKEIEEVCKKQKALFIKIEPTLDQDLETLEKEGYRISFLPLLPPSTIFIDLQQDKEQLWEKISHSGKYSINRARRENVTVEFFRNPNAEMIEIFYNLSLQTSHKKNFGVASLEDLKKKVEIFKDDSYIIAARNAKDKVTVANFYLGHKDAVWYVHGGTSDVGRKNKDGYLLVFESFLYFKNINYKFLDLEGVYDSRFPTFTKNWGGFTHFKEKFGGEKIVYPYPYIKLLAPVLKVLERIYGKIPL